MVSLITIHVTSNVGRRDYFAVPLTLDPFRCQKQKKQRTINNVCRRYLQKKRNLNRKRIFVCRNVHIIKEIYELFYA